MEYEVNDHGSMIADRVRMDAYVEALELSVKPGDIVVDVGAGIGIMALLACRLGAKTVIAIERDDVIEVGREIARANNVDDRVEFIKGRSTQIELLQKADVIVSDLRGVLPFHAGHIGAIVDARIRLLAPGGVMIPKRDTLWVAVVEASATYQERIDYWSQHDRGFDLSAARDLVTNTWWKERVKEHQVLSERQLVATLDYATIVDTGVKSSSVVAVHQGGTAHGLCLWFDAELTDGQGFSNAPGKPEAVYGCAFFPLEHPVDVEEGDAVHLELRAVLAGRNYMWAWSTTVERAGEVVAHYRQATAFGTPLTKTLLEQNSPGFVPELAVDGAKLKLALELMAGELNLQEIADRVAGHFPQRFVGEPDSLEFVVGVAQKYSR